ncbi:MAG: hypothetical protein E6X17_07965 [Sporomusaceae bacterium]|nr:hypothetical protein [Sporomusaceae bacterium]
MKKMLVAAVAAALLQFAPAVPVQAASLQQSISDFVIQNPNILQQVIEVKQDLDQGNKDAALNKVVAAVVANNNSEVVDLLANGSLVETVGDRVKQEVATQVRQQVEDRFGDKLLPYQNQIAAVAQLLNQQAGTRQDDAGSGPAAATN